MAVQASSEQDRPKPGTYSLSLHAMGTMGFHGLNESNMVIRMDKNG